MPTLIINPGGYTPPDAPPSRGTQNLTGTGVIELLPGASYVIDVSGTDGGATEVNVQRQLGNGDWVTYDDSPGEVPASFGIDVPWSGKVRVELVGATNPNLIFAWARVLSRLG